MSSSACTFAPAARSAVTAAHCCLYELARPAPSMPPLLRPASICCAIVLYDAVVENGAVSVAVGAGENESKKYPTPPAPLTGSSTCNASTVPDANHRSTGDASLAVPSETAPTETCVVFVPRPLVATCTRYSVPYVPITVVGAATISGEGTEVPESANRVPAVPATGVSKANEIALPSSTHPDVGPTRLEPFTVTCQVVAEGIPVTSNPI